MTKKKITVIGSINMDIVTSTNILPKMGETVLGKAFHTIPGGKGANQAVAAARLGADVTLIGCVGDDIFGKELKQHLKQQGINVENVEPVTETSTGTASITLYDGDNNIIVVPGANYHVTPDYIEGLEKIIAESDVVLLQLEIPLETVERTVEIARRHKATIILNPAPIQPLSKELLSKVNYITPNEHEQEMLLTSFEWADEERKEIIKKCIVTKGSKGVSILKEDELKIPSFSVDVVDTTGAGDTFNGALAYCLSMGYELEEACRFANATAALSVTKFGAQGGMPTLQEVEEFLQQRGEKRK
ncbi:ribokinase [Cytobacillus massiliigabonensis]|uniref:ribokinase n=1 Tax=Cytobacillus massiliigabonensis TaxID=1871011 RepID=UPI000C849F6B|nr:ribokinase [Cytobacillus massiliigabonensis]